ncbi:hypothetical protein GC194_11050 [bacterium]|nr:hypothetical protein [bacterium]
MNGRHEARSLLVNRDLRQVFSSYKWLDDESRNARYVTYKFNKAFAEKAFEHLQKIERACTE